MKKQLLMKTFLVAVCLLGGGNVVWGQKTTLYERGYETVWAASDISTTEWSGSGAELSDGYLKVSSNASNASVTKTISYAGVPILTFDAVWNIGTKTGNNNASNRTYFMIGNKIKFQHYPRSAANWAKVTISGEDIKTLDGSPVEANALWTIHVVINTNTNTITEFSVTSSNDAFSMSLSDIAEAKRTLANDADYTTITLGTEAGTKPETVLQKIKVQSTPQAIATYGYTVNYKVGGTLVKQVVVENGGVGALAEGSNIPVLSAFDGDDMTGNGGEDYSDKRYVLVADAPVQTVTTTIANNVLDVSVREKYSTTMTVTRYFDGVAEETPFINAQELVETDDKDNSWTYVFPYYVQNNAKWYRATLKGASNDKYGATGTFTTVAISERVDYTLDEDVVFYSENGSGTSINYSNGGNDTYWQSQSIGSLNAGTYEMTAMQQAGYSCTLYNGWVDSGNKGTALITFSNSNRTDYFALTENTTSLQLHSGSNARMDYILIRRISSVSIPTCDALGYTFSSKLPLNFTGKNVEAYTAAYNSTTEKVELSRVYKVPANTGLFIKGSADDIPVLTGDADAMGTNNLIAVSATTMVSQTAGDNTNFVLGVDNASAPTAAVFLKAPTAGVSVGAGKAYLQIPTASVPAAARMAVVFNDETTGISHIENGALRMDNSVYNLSGQRVSQPTKGLYIVNGKKVVIK